MGGAVCGGWFQDFVVGFLFCCGFFWGGWGVLLQLSLEMNDEIKHRSFHRKLLEMFYYWLILANTISLCFEITLPGNRSSIS